MKSKYSLADKVIVAQSDNAEKSLGVLALTERRIRSLKIGARDPRYSLFAGTRAFLASLRRI
jgi:hypothetical protein